MGCPVYCVKCGGNFGMPLGKKGEVFCQCQEPMTSDDAIRADERAKVVGEIVEWLRLDEDDDYLLRISSEIEKKWGRK